MKNEKLEVSQSELSKVKDNLLNKEQLGFLFQETPKNHIYTRPAKGGGTWSYVTGIYMKKVLNLMFGWNWDFEIIEETVSLEWKQVVVKGKLTVRTGELGSSIVKMQYGRQDIKFRKVTEHQKIENLPLDIGNDMKGAATDCLKKCAAEFGIAADVYSPNEFKSITIVEDAEPRSFDDLTKLVNNANTIDELQILWGSFSVDEQKIATIQMEVRKKEILELKHHDG